MIQKHSTSKFATKLKFKTYKPNKNSQFFLCVSTNTDINKLNWRFNHIFLVITKRDFYCMTRMRERMCVCVCGGGGGGVLIYSLCVGITPRTEILIKTFLTSYIHCAHVKIIKLNLLNTRSFPKLFYGFSLKRSEVLPLPILNAHVAISFTN